MENINKQIKDLEDQIRELQLEKYKIGLLNELRLDEEDLKSVKDLITGDKNRVNFFALPGVPKEMKSMFTNYVLPEIEKSLKNKVVCKSIRTTGVPESILQEKITDIIDANKEKCDIAFLPHRMLGVDIRLTSSDNQLVEDLINSIVPRIKKYV